MIILIAVRSCNAYMAGPAANVLMSYPVPVKMSPFHIDAEDHFGT